MKRLFTHEDDQYIYEHFRNTSYAELAAKFNVTERQLRGHINNMGWSKRVQRDCSYFATIDSAQKAYWLGLLYADGYLAYHPERRTYEVAIELHEKDLSTLEQFRVDVGIACKITHKEQDKSFNGCDYHTSSNVLRIYSKEMCDNLIRCGLVPHKTYESEHPAIDVYQHAFVRGFLDGDGCIYVSPTGHHQVTFTNANELFLQYLQSLIRLNCGAEGHIYRERELKYRLVYYSLQSIMLLLDWVYQEDGAWRMERKYQKYISLQDGLAA